jgi:ketosteroid isomerase-like protein
MSREDSELAQIARRGYDAFNRGDLEASLADLDPGIEWWPASDEPITDPYRGHDGYRRLLAEAREGVPDLQVEIEELYVVGDQVVTCVRFWGRGRDSGASVEIRETHLARVRQGKIIEVREYREKHEALEAVGLRESGGPRASPGPRG